ncbi:hypothetical protein FA95DRAFT_1288592 [Auriscalpium vulgare]|uniref:Uncharacterized protein n=1 Tax=Auriscalpium vulgare TaxID=40419 RepID=A0ACB8RTW1_9AGAM|nr:hypothetical protein FA95DRAFT_1288592 [Auriscalpium vulgare]
MNESQTSAPSTSSQPSTTAKSTSTANMPPRLARPEFQSGVKQEDMSATVPSMLTSTNGLSIGHIQHSASSQRSTSSPTVNGSSLVTEASPEPFKTPRAPQDWTSTVDMDEDPPFRADPFPPSTPLPPHPPPIGFTPGTTPTPNASTPTPTALSANAAFPSPLWEPSFVPPMSQSAVHSPVAASASQKSVGYGSPSAPPTPTSASNAHPLPPKPLVVANKIPRHKSPVSARVTEMRRTSQPTVPLSGGVKRKVSSPMPDSPVDAAPPQQLPLKRAQPSSWPTVSPIRTAQVTGDNTSVRGIVFNGAGTFFAVNCTSVASVVGICAKC